ncbi:hypothetical protein ACEXQB_007330 [Herbiconiux sp. P18]|uniref:hypothetical protein n=1 Tax=Herbiconiux liangxiaofengii TaxID=3342795 RepID=UPI0035B8EF85
MNPDLADAVMVTGSRVEEVEGHERWEFSVHSTGSTDAVLVDSFDFTELVDDEALRALVDRLYGPLGLRLEIVTSKPRLGRFVARVIRDA